MTSPWLRPTNSINCFKTYYNVVIMYAAPLFIKLKHLALVVQFYELNVPEQALDGVPLRFNVHGVSEDKPSKCLCKFRRDDL